MFFGRRVSPGKKHTLFIKSRFTFLSSKRIRTSGNSRVISSSAWTQFNEKMAQFFLLSLFFNWTFLSNDDIDGERLGEEKREHEIWEKHVHFLPFTLSRSVPFPVREDKTTHRKKKKKKLQNWKSISELMSPPEQAGSGGKSFEFVRFSCDFAFLFCHVKKKVKDERAERSHKQQLKSSKSS